MTNTTNTIAPLSAEELDKPAFEAWAREACNMPPGAPINWDAAWTKAAHEGWQAARRASPAFTVAGELPPLIYVRKATLDLIAGSSFVKHDIVVRTEPNDGWVALGAIAADRAQQAVVAPSVKTWQERAKEVFGDHWHGYRPDAFMSEEIADLRAQLAQHERVHQIMVDTVGDIGQMLYAVRDMVPADNVGLIDRALATAGIRPSGAQVPVAQADVVRLLCEARATLEMWKDVAPAVSLCADIDKALASAAQEQARAAVLPEDLFFDLESVIFAVENNDIINARGIRELYPVEQARKAIELLRTGSLAAAPSPAAPQQPVAQVGEHPQGIYVASRASVPARPKMWQSLRADGWPITSSWIDEAGEGQTADFTNLWKRIQDEIASSCGVILYAEESDFPLKGAFIECGMALGMGKPVAVVLKFPLMDRSMKPLGSWANHPQVKLCQSLDQAKRHIETTTKGANEGTGEQT